jgi:hypothetical protein
MYSVCGKDEPETMELGDEIMTLEVTRESSITNNDVFQWVAGSLFVRSDEVPDWFLELNEDPDGFAVLSRILTLVFLERHAMERLTRTVTEDELERVIIEYREKVEQRMELEKLRRISRHFRMYPIDFFSLEDEYVTIISADGRLSSRDIGELLDQMTGDSDCGVSDD